MNGIDSFDAAKLDQNQREITHYGVAAYQYAGDRLNFQIAPFVRYSQTKFTPDPDLGDVIINGSADRARLSSLASGVQADGSLRAGSAHNVRFGLFFQNEHTTSDVVSTVLAVDADGDQTSDVPFTIADRHSKTGQLYGAYLQDEWKLTSNLTLNYGARFDIVHAYTREKQLSPRANLVWQAYSADHAPPRLRAQLHPAAAGADRAVDADALQRHDQATEDESRTRSRRSANIIWTRASSSG